MFGNQSSLWVEDVRMRTIEEIVEEVKLFPPQERLRFISSEDKERSFSIFGEHLDWRKILADHLLHVGSRTVAQPDPYNLRRKPKDKTPLVKIRILRHDHKTLLLGILLDHWIFCLFQAHLSDMGGVREEVC